MGFLILKLPCLWLVFLLVAWTTAIHFIGFPSNLIRAAGKVFQPLLPDCV